ncbi:TetR/AcrR family transcriptional regulator [Neobacillus sp. LXY-1]|uniref:TetR/AcrR family transcriptional regulator n=1 Tax=Neobacillus sp. LXY-1 TaxID=3379133 RepID=UPI003EE0D5FC
METVDRRVLKSQEAIKTAFIELMAERNFDQITIQEIADRANVGRRTVYAHYLDKFDLLEKLIDEHLEELERICDEKAEESFIDGTIIWFEYFDKHELFFSTMLASKGAPTFRSRFLQYVIDELHDEVHVYEGKNKGLNKELLLQFFGVAIVGVVEAYILNAIKENRESLPKQIGILLERNL